MLFQDDNFYYLWKPAGRPSTYGQQECFLYKMESGAYEEYLQVYHHSEGYSRILYNFFHTHHPLRELEHVDDLHALIAYLMGTFSREQEFGLVNRLDNETAGFLYFAKTPYVYSHFKKRQEQGRVFKHYLALVHGDFRFVIDHPKKYHLHKMHDKVVYIDYPIMHHAQLDDRMVVATTEKKQRKGRGKLLLQSTHAELLSYHEDRDFSLLHLTLKQGVRHQIRAHLAHLGYPILGEKLYDTRDELLDGHLHLRSVGCEVQADQKVLHALYKVKDIMNQEIHMPWQRDKNEEDENEQIEDRT